MSEQATIAAIPTTYRGRRYRSRLEARWAAFFDLLGWQHEYEPFDLGVWSPDFLLSRADADWPLLVEIKPIEVFDSEVALRMQQAHAERDRGEQLLLLGTCPTRISGPRHFPQSDHVRLGWLQHDEEPWFDAFLHWGKDPSRLRLRPDIAAGTQAFRVSPSWRCAFTEWDCGAGEYSPTVGYADHGLGLWAEAANAVQWRAPR